MKKITNKLIEEFKTYLIEEEKSGSTLEKYIRDITVFMNWLKGAEITKTKVLEYKKVLIENYAPASVNSILSSLNSFFNYNEWHECKVKTLKIQRQIFANKDRELTKAEYERLLKAALNKKNKRLYYLMQTICSSGIRVSELKYVDVNAVKTGQALINCKSKMRVVILPKGLCKMQKKYIKEQRITSGSVFVSKNGKPLDRSNIHKMLKSLCEDAGVDRCKVFPYNLCHTCASLLLKNGVPMKQIQEWLGHSDFSTTANIYSHLDYDSKIISANVMMEAVNINI